MDNDDSESARSLASDLSHRHGDGDDQADRAEVSDNEFADDLNSDSESARSRASDLMLSMRAPMRGLHY